MRLVMDGNFALCQPGPNIQKLFKDKIIQHLIVSFGSDSDVVDERACFVETLVCNAGFGILQKFQGFGNLRY